MINFTNDKVLVQKLRLGDIGAYQYLFDEYFYWLCNYIYKLSGDSNVSQDIVQEVMINIWEKRNRIVITTSIKSYLFKSCHNQFLQHIKKQKRNADLLDNIRWETIFDTYYIDFSEQEDFYEEKLFKLNQLLSKLPPRCREIFIKNKLEKRKYREIASDMDISIKTVESQMSKALHFLKTNAHNFFI